MACDGLLQDLLLPRILREMPNREAARNEVARVLHQVATAMERTAELLRTQLITLVLFVLPPGMLYWGSAFQLFVNMLSDICLARNIDLCAPNLRIGQNDLRPAALSVHAYLAAMSRLLQTLDVTIHMPQKWNLSSSINCIFRETRANRILVKQFTVLIMDCDALCNQKLRIVIIERT